MSRRGFFFFFKVGSNGIISFGSAYNPFNNTLLSNVSGQYVVAPFWDDININNGGIISYEIFKFGYYLEQVSAFIRRETSTYFTGTWMMNVYYQQVAPYSGFGQVNDSSEQPK